VPPQKLGAGEALEPETACPLRCGWWEDEGVWRGCGYGCSPCADAIHARRLGGGGRWLRVEEIVLDL
jgi:hypothetical protein